MRFYRAQIFVLAFTILNLVKPTLAHADSVTVFTDRNAFLAASLLNSTINFAGIAPEGGAVGFGTPGSATISGVTFKSGPSVELAVVNPPSGALHFYDTGSISGGALLVVSPIFNPAAILDVTLPGTFTAIGFDVGASLTAVVNVQLPDGTNLAFTLPEPEGPNPLNFIPGKFFGFTTTNGISSFRISGVLDNRPNRPRSPLIDIDDFRYGEAAAVPEPGSIVLIAIGIAGLALSRRQQK